MKYTRHGKHRVAERGISEKVILEAVSKPSHSFYDLTSAAYVAFKKLDGKLSICLLFTRTREMRLGL